MERSEHAPCKDLHADDLQQYQGKGLKEIKFGVLHAVKAESKTSLVVLAYAFEYGTNVMNSVTSRKQREDFFFNIDAKNICKNAKELWVPKIENAAFCGGPRIHLVKGKVNAS